MRGAGRKRLRHPEAGLLTSDYETVPVPAAPEETDLVVHVLSAEEASREAVALARPAPATTEARQEPSAARGGGESQHPSGRAGSAPPCLEIPMAALEGRYVRERGH